MKTPKANSGVELLRPKRLSVPLIFASPHSGRDYPKAFVESSRLSAGELRKSEDSFVDEIFAAAPKIGAPLLRAHFPRAYVDANRRPFELDTAMFSDPLPDYVTTCTPHITAGLGTIPRIVASGKDIYAQPLTFAEAKQRIERHYMPYHDTLADLIAQAQETFGLAVLIDCHSMPASGGGQGYASEALPDIVLGDCYGRSCNKIITDTAHTLCRNAGLSVARNRPYAGGYTTRHYGNPDGGVHTLQIEISRSLHMDEARNERGPGLKSLSDHMTSLIEALARLDFPALRPALPKAAE